MKDPTREDIKVDSVWERRDETGFRLRVTSYDGATVYYVYDLVPNLFTSLKARGWNRPDYSFLEYFKPVYTVQGFEV